MSTDVILARGAKNMGDAEELERRAAEVHPPKPPRITIPVYLPKDLHKKFRTIAKQLIDLNMLSSLDFDCLARYLIAEQEYVAVTADVNKALANKNYLLLDNLTKIQNRYFTQCRGAAADLGLTISSRVKLVIPVPVPMPQQADPLFGD